MTVRQTFWSRRKQAVEAEAAQQEAARAAAEEAQVLRERERKPDDELLQELGLPNPDDLTAGDDFSAFMSKTVPARLRNRALRKLWLSNPVLANLDDLVDYAGDYTDAANTGEPVKTAYQVGKGLMKHVEELARLRDPAPETATDDVDPPETSAIHTEEPAAAAATPATESEQSTTETPDLAPRRRMRFVVRAAQPPQTGGMDAG